MPFEFDDELTKEIAAKSDKSPSREINGYRLVDADTLARTKDDARFRASNLSAPETSHVKGGVFVPGQIGGDETHRGMADLMEELQGQPPIGDVTGKKTYGREIAPFTAADLAYRAGIVRPDRRATPEAIRAASEGYLARTLFPSYAEQDPIQQIGQRTRASIAQAAAKEGVPLYRSPVELRDEAQRASLNNYRSNIAIGEDSKMIADYQKELDSGKLDPDTAKEYQQRINILRAQIFSRSSTPDIAADTVTFRSSDRTLDNQAKDQ